VIRYKLPQMISSFEDLLGLVPCASYYRNYK